jgi:hypothetical protein
MTLKTNSIWQKLKVKKKLYAFVQKAQNVEGYPHTHHGNFFSAA